MSTKPSENKSGKTIEFSTPEVWERPWGEEVLVVHTDQYTGKLLKYKKGQGGNFQKHQIKDEAGYILSGKLLLEWDDVSGNSHLGLFCTLRVSLCTDLCEQQGLLRPRDVPKLQELKIQLSSHFYSRSVLCSYNK
jgi:hypothetical protein